MKKSNGVVCVALMFLRFFLVEVAIGQVTTGTIVGTLFDPSAASLPGVEVTVTNVGTSATRVLTTNELGEYTAPLLSPGVYKITAELKGFKKATVEDVRLRVDQELRRNITLEIGEITQELTVKAESVAVGTENPVLGEVISDEQIVDLPLNGRSFIQLAALSAGITSPGTAQGESATTAFAQRSSVAVSISGQRENTTDYRFDGIPSKDRVIGPVGMQPDVDSIAEFKIQRGYASADVATFGRINVVTKSGTNNFHGSAWEFLRNDKFDARNSFASRKLPFRQNQFGVTAGGSIIKNKLFYFGDYEVLRIRRTSPGLGRVPIPENLRGNFAGAAPIIDPLTGQPFSGNIIPTARISKFAQTYNQFIPAPNAAGTANRAIGVRFLQDDNKYNIRIDYAHSQSDTLFGRYTHNNSEQLSEGFAPFSGNQAPIRGRNAVLSWTHIFSPNLLNSFKVGLNRVLNFPYLPQGAETNQPFRTLFGFQSVNELPQCNALANVGMAGYNTFGGGSLCIVWTTNDYHFANNLSYTRGRHRMSTGFEIVRTYVRHVTGVWGQGVFSFTGQYTGNPVADYLLGIPFSATGQDYARIPDRRAIWPSFYFNDDIHVTKSFNLNLGLRYDYFQPLAEDNHKLVSFDPFVPGGGFLYEPGSGLDSIGRIGHKGLFVPDKNNFAPRLGIAWSPKENLAIRSSYGIFYQEIGGNRLNTTLTGPPFVLTTGLFGEATRPTVNLDRDVIFPRQSPPFRGPGVSSFGFNPNVRNAYLQAWTMSIQQTFSNNFFAEAAYIGSKGTKLDKLEDLNIPSTPPPPGFTGSLQSRRPFPDFGFVLYADNDANSNYHALQLTLKKTSSRGLSFLTNYTFSKSLDGDSFDNKGTRNYIPGQPDKARSVFDQRHRFSLSWVYNLPAPRPSNVAASLLLKGWQISGITTLQSGFPLHPTTSRDYSNRLTTFTNLPNRICDGNLPSNQRKPERWFDTSCFVPPALNTLGNSGFHILDTDGLVNQDLGLIKNFAVREPLKVQFRAEFFNLFNHPNFGRPNIGVESALFGRVLSTLPARIMQFGLKFYW